MKTYVLVDEHGEPTAINEVPVYTPRAILERLRSTKPILYIKMVVPLDAARTGVDSEAFDFVGDFLFVQDITGTATAQIVFNEPKQSKIDVADRLRVSTPFYRFFIINSAQVGESITLYIGKESLFTMGGFEASETTLASVLVELAKKPDPATTPVIYNVTMTVADTEYSQVLPANTKRFSIRTRDGTAFRMAFVTGKVAAPTEPYFSILANIPYIEEQIEVSALTLYFGCGGAGKICEIVAWS